MKYGIDEIRMAAPRWRSVSLFRILMFGAKTLNFEIISVFSSADIESGMYNSHLEKFNSRPINLNSSIKVEKSLKTVKVSPPRVPSSKY